MPQDHPIEVYTQRYETFRHLDKLRWQMLQLAAGAGSVAIAFGGGNGLEWWVLAILAAILMLLGYTMWRIRDGILSNNETLRQAGEKIGDDGVPQRSAWCHSAGFWVALMLIVLGAICAGLAIFQYRSTDQQHAPSVHQLSPQK